MDAVVQRMGQQQSVPGHAPVVIEHEGCDARERGTEGNDDAPYFHTPWRALMSQEPRPQNHEYRYAEHSTLEGTAVGENSGSQSQQHSMPPVCPPKKPG